MYEVGCLAALEDFFDGFYASDFDAFVGTSAGSTVAVALSGGLRAARLYRALLDPADDFFPLRRQHLLGVDAQEWRRVASTVLSAARRSLASFIASPLETDVWHELERFIDSLPAGLFALDAYEKFLAEFMERDRSRTVSRSCPSRWRWWPTIWTPASDVCLGPGLTSTSPSSARRPPPRPCPSCMHRCASTTATTSRGA